MAEWPFFLQPVLRNTGQTKKRTRNSKEMLKPTYFGIKDEQGSKIQIKELYNNGHFLTVEAFNQKFKTKINSLNHRTLKNVMEENLTLKNNTRMNTEETEMEPHWISSITKLFH